MLRKITRARVDFNLNVKSLVKISEECTAADLMTVFMFMLKPNLSTGDTNVGRLQEKEHSV